MGREEGKGRPWPLEAPHLFVVKAVVPVPPVKSSQCPTMDSLQQIQTCSGLSESTVLWGCSPPSQLKTQKLVFITELRAFFKCVSRSSTLFGQMDRDYVPNVCG